MDYELAIKIFGGLLALLFLIYARYKARPPKKQFNHLKDVHEEPDVVSKAAGGIFKAHKIYSQFVGFIILGVVIALTILDSLTRIIVFSTLGLMVIIALIWKLIHKFKNL